VDTQGWVEAPPPFTNVAPGQASSREKPVVLALDCEMVDVASASRKGLARIAVVNFWTDELLMDELVKPTDEIIDYLTQ
jgi:RNA exonuclease 1